MVDEIEHDAYTEEGREEMVKEGVLTDADEGFMKGYEEGEKSAKCPVCGKVILDEFIEKKIDGEVYRFCCETHADAYRKKED